MTVQKSKSDPIRILMAKVGLDGHDRGVKIVARYLRDAGMEVIYTGLHRTPEQVAAIAVQEDADVVGVSILSGAHMTAIPRLLDCLRAVGAVDVHVVVGGVVPDEDVPALKSLGVADVLLQETPPETIAASSDATLLTRICLPLRNAPVPRSAHASSSYAGAHETPSTMRPPRISAICVEKNGHSRTNDLVPSIGSTSQTLSAFMSDLPVSSP